MVALFCRPLYRRVALAVQGFMLLMWCCASACAAQWSAGAYFGVAHTDTSALSVTQAPVGTSLRFTDVSYRSESLQGPLYYGVQAGHSISSRWTIEVEFTHLKVFANVNDVAHISGALNGVPVDSVQPVNRIVQRFSISHGVNLLLANAVLRQPLLEHPGEKLGTVVAVLRFGAGTTVPHAESTIEEHADEHYQVGSPAVQVAAGIEVRASRRLYWQAEYRLTRVRETVDVFAGNATTLLLSHHFVTGPLLRF